MDFACLSLCCGITTLFQMLFETNSIFSIFSVFLESPFVKKIMVCAGHFITNEFDMPNKYTIPCIFAIFFFHLCIFLQIETVT